MNHNEDEVLDFMNRLLERLQQAGGNQNGSHNIQFVYVAPGAQHVGTVQNQYFHPAPSPAPERGGEMPEVLATDKAMALWRKAQRAGYVDEHYQPLLSRTQAALLADAMAERLGIMEKWKVFETLWHRKYMRSDYNLALTRKVSLDFQDELKQLFG
jgi:hypothetical protein